MTDNRVKWTLQEAADFVGVTKARIRSIAESENAPFTMFKEKMPGLNMKISYVWADEVQTYKEFRDNNPRVRKERVSGGTRVRGMTAYVTHLSDTELAQFNELFPGKDIKPRNANYDPDKNKAYREARLARIAADKAAKGEVVDTTPRKRGRKPRNGNGVAVVSAPVTEVVETPVQNDELSAQLDALLEA